MFGYRVEVAEVYAETLDAVREVLKREGYLEVAPVVTAPVTDPLTGSVGRVEFYAYGGRWVVTTSMIFHKQIAATLLGAVFAVSPNIRLERRKSDNHLFEFIQVDVEKKGASREEMMRLVESILCEVVQRVKGRCGAALKRLGRKLPEIEPPFERVSFRDVKADAVGRMDVWLSKRIERPTWVVDFTVDSREFYDREDPERQGTLLDMDLILPEGHGEVVSGGEREFEPERVKRRLVLQGLSEKSFTPYLEAVAQRLIGPTAGFGIGIERLVRWLCGLSTIAETRLFPRVPGCLSRM